MRVTQEFFNQLDPSYQKVLLEMDNQLQTAKKKNKLINEFSKKYLLPKEYWDFMWNFYESRTQAGFAWSKVLKDFVYESSQHFYFAPNFSVEHPKRSWKLLHSCSHKLKHATVLTDWAMEDLSYPHSELKESFENYQKFLNSLPSKKIYDQYKSLKALYSEIKAADNDVDKWFKALCKFFDEEFICQNVEYRLGKNLLDKDLWKLYIEYFEKQNSTKMLQIYSKYCRFYLDDSEMKEKYQRAAERFSLAKVEWDEKYQWEIKSAASIKPKNKYSYESNARKSNLNQIFLNDDADILVDNEFSKKAKRALKKTKAKNRYSTIQKFSLPPTIMDYILQTSNHIFLRKLYKTCKYFFHKNQVPICYKLEIGGDHSNMDGPIKMLKETLIIDENKKNYNLTKKFFITTILNISNRTENSRYFSNFIPNIYRCDAKFISIINQDLFYDEIKQLLKRQTVVNLTFKGGKIEYFKNGGIASIEDVLILVPKIKCLEFENTKTTRNTAFSLLNHSLKIEHFELTETIVGESFDTIDFYNFKIDKKSCYISLNFKNKFNEKLVDELCDGMKKNAHLLNNSPVGRKWIIQPH